MTIGFHVKYRYDKTSDSIVEKRELETKLETKSERLIALLPKIALLPIPDPSIADAFRMIEQMRRELLDGR